MLYLFPILRKRRMLRVVCQIRGAFRRPNPTHDTLHSHILLGWAFVVPMEFLCPNRSGWPADAFGTCEEELDGLFQTPDVMLADGCSDVWSVQRHLLACGLRSEEIVVDRTWTVTDCDSVYTHVQPLGTSLKSSRLINSDVSGHFFSNTFDWLPVLQDNCNAALEGGILLSDT